MVIKSLLPLSDEKEKNHKHEQHVLITEYLIGTNKTTIETKEDEHNIIAVSPNDHRWYRLIELRNGLRCMLVTNNLLENEEDEQEQEEEDEKINQHDTEGLSSDAEEAFFKYHMTTVALYIPAGSLLDPSNVQGLAHLTEHLIFSSSSKYPEMNCLDSFVSYHGGTIRAYTELEFTVIVIEISSNRVVETLDILIHSLIDPLMLSETIFDQVQVIDEESTIAQFDDHYRASRLLAHLAKENHPIRNFSWGNKKSLKEFASNVNSTTILKQLVKDRYCIPEGMNLVMISDESFRVMQQRVERLFCLMKRSYKILPDYIGLKEPWNTDNFQKFHLEVFYMTQNLLELGYIPKILLPSLRATQLPVQQTITKVESYQSNDCATHMLIVFEHGITSIRDYILIEILAEIIQESLEDYLQTVGQNHFTCNVTLRDTYGIISLQIELMFSCEIHNSMDVVDYISRFFVQFKDLIMETTTIEFERLLSMFRNTKQTIDNSLQTCIDRYWTEIILNSLVFDRHSRERNSLDTLTVTDMQEWFNEHIIGSTRRQLIIIVCPQDEVRRKPIDIIQSNRASHGTHDNQQNRHSIRSNGTVSIERLSRLVHRQDLFEDEENTNGHVSVLQSKSESKLRCLTTKRKHNINLRLTKSETLYLNKPFDYPNDVMKLDYIIKSFESIEINDDHNKNQYDKSLKILLESDSNESEKPRVFIHNLKQFKESCLLYNVTCVK
ncbi:unnamed protein product [Rotaria magnacalcarata]|uniref:Peptidase M16 N-terminal domain-containing protein n=1 Tax=Rotaria magnacalcarata TaxID=392030 RepID=A0A818XW13_9BILA|nr:unnamed protein product [Rotaria magnacalcarata]